MYGNGKATMRMGHCKCNILCGDKIFGTALEQAALGVVLFWEIVHETFALRYDEAFCAFHGDESAGFKIFPPLLWVMGSTVL